MERPTSQPGGFFMPVSPRGEPRRRKNMEKEKLLWPFDIETWVQEKLAKENQESEEDHAL